MEEAGINRAENGVKDLSPQDERQQREHGRHLEKKEDASHRRHHIRSSKIIQQVLQ